MHQSADALAWLAVIGVYYWVYRYRWFDVPSSLWGIVALVIAQDFFYYWFHRAIHRIRWMWASHVTHHSSERLNLSTAFRQSITYPISGMWLFKSEENTSELQSLMRTAYAVFCLQKTITT